MIKPVRAWQDSQGVFHVTREAACKAEFRRLLLATGWCAGETPHPADNAVSLDVLVENMFELDKIFGEATKEDARVQMASDADDGR